MSIYKVVLLLLLQGYKHIIFIVKCLFIFLLIDLLIIYKLNNAR